MENEKKRDRPKLVIWSPRSNFQLQVCLLVLVRSKQLAKNIQKSERETAAVIGTMFQFSRGVKITFYLYIF